MKIRNVKRTLKSARVLKGKNLTSKQYFDAVLEYQKALVTVVNNGTTFKEIKNYFQFLKKFPFFTRNVDFSAYCTIQELKFWEFTIFHFSQKFGIIL